jgi:flavin-dependent dehydrogenase
MPRERSIDVLIVGGGPAGSTAGALVAAAGIEAVIVESEVFPRFHVGESLLPNSLPFFDELGVHDRIRALPHTRRKDGASFVTHDGSKHVVYWFDEAMAPAVPHAYQVRRDEFDAMLLAHAGERGAEVLQGWKVTTPHWEGNRFVGVTARDPNGNEWLLRCRAFLDASGQSSFLAGRMGWRFAYQNHRKAAAVSHFRGAWLPPGREAGNITIAIAPGGWFWLIPFADDTVSVGVVADISAWRGHPNPESLFRAMVDRTPEVARRLAGAEPTLPFSAIQNFSYRVMHMAGDGYCLIGDAAGFLDPIFSTGVYLGMTTAASAARDVIDALTRHGRLEGSDFGPTVSLARDLQRLFFSLIRAYYDPNFLAFFFSPSSRFKMRAAIVSILAADVVGHARWRKTLRFRTLVGLSRLQAVAGRRGLQLVEPLTTTPAG